MYKINDRSSGRNGCGGKWTGLSSLNKYEDRVHALEKLQSGDQSGKPPANHSIFAYCPPPKDFQIMIEMEYMQGASDAKKNTCKSESSA